eukprot:378350_1
MKTKKIPNKPLPSTSSNISPSSGPSTSMIKNRKTKRNGYNNKNHKRQTSKVRPYTSRFNNPIDHISEDDDHSDIDVEEDDDHNLQMPVAPKLRSSSSDDFETQLEMVRKKK